MPGRAARLRTRTAAAALLWLGLGAAAMAQTDEIQVYDATINEPGQFSVELHNNYTPEGRTSPDFPGGVVPNHALNGVPEWALGITPWLELGTYLPLYTVTSEGRFELNGFKFRTLFVSPHAKERTIFYGINFELSFNARHWEETYNSGEIRPIIGTHLGPWDLIFNPILDTGFNGVQRLDFAPAERVAYNFSESWAAALEHYADYGYLGDLAGLKREQQMGYAVVDYNGEPNSIEFGVGHGFTAASDAVVLKLMVTHDF